MQSAEFWPKCKSVAKRVLSFPFIVLVRFYQLLRKSKGEYGNEGIQSVDYTCSKTGDETRHMTFAQGLLHHKNGYRPDRG